MSTAVVSEVSYGDLHISVDDQFVATAEIRRPPNNFFDLGLVESLASAFSELDDDPLCRAIVLCSDGKHFCAGANFDGDADPAIATNADGSKRHLYDAAHDLFQTKTPVVAAVQGAAIGGGLGVACMPDFRIGCPESRFSANFARLGFHHGFALSVTLPAIIGQQRTLEMLYTGRRIKGDEAAQIGLIDRLVPRSQVREVAHGLAVEIAMSAPLAVSSIRETMRGDLARKVRQATDREKAEQDRLRKTYDWSEGVKAMSERRPPNFTGT